MDYAVIEQMAFAVPSRRVVRRFESYGDAVAWVEDTYDVVLLEADPDYDGCADVFTRTGQFYAIVPAEWVGV